MAVSLRSNPDIPARACLSVVSLRQTRSSAAALLVYNASWAANSAKRASLQAEILIRLPS